MKKYIAFMALFTASAAALMSLSGRTSEQARGTSVTSDAPLSVPATYQIDSAVNEETEIAWEIPETPDELRSEPPQLQVIYSGDGLVNCAAMTLGTYTWDVGGDMVCADSIGPVACAAEGFIIAVVDLDAVAENEPKINLWGGAEITGVQLYPLEGDAVSGLEFTADGVITVPEDIYEGVVCVSTKFPEGEADYFFMVERTLTDPSKPPELRVFTGGIGFSMTKGAYEWTYTDGDETVTEMTDIDSPWELYQSGHVKPDLWVLPGETLTIMLPEGGELTAAEYWTEDSVQPLKFTGRELTMPQQELSAVCSVTVKMPAGTCDYLFSVNVGESASSPAYEPEVISD